MRSRLTAPILWLSLLLCSSLQASDYGTTGLIDIPTARMASDGVLTATAAVSSPAPNAYSSDLPSFAVAGGDLPIHWVQ